jgi:anti-anti-sigma factor
MIGAFDLAQRERVATAFASVADQPVVALDLERTTYIDSIALGCIIRLHGDLLDRGGKLYLANSSNVAKRILEVTGLSTVFNNRADLDALLGEGGFNSGALRRVEILADSNI